MIIQDHDKLRQQYRQDVETHHEDWVRMEQINAKYWVDFVKMHIRYTPYEIATAWEYDQKWRNRILSIVQKDHSLRYPEGASHPTFDLLKEKQKLDVRNPDNGKQFTICLKDWHGVLWFLGICEHKKLVSPYIAMGVRAIEDYLGRLEIV